MNHESDRLDNFTFSMRNRYMIFALSAISVTSDLWCSGEPNNQNGNENTIDMSYFVDTSAQFCINDDNEFQKFAYICELKPSKLHLWRFTVLVKCFAHLML